MDNDNDIEFLYIGWCHGVKNGVTSDKVWTAFKAGGAYYAGWGARGKSIRFKRHYDRVSLMAVKRQKERGYEEVDAFKLFTIFPTFPDDVASKLTFDILLNKVM